MGSKAFNLSHFFDTWAYIFKAFFCQILHCDILDKSVITNPGIHFSIPICWQTVVCPRRVISNRLRGIVAQEKRASIHHEVNIVFAIICLDHQVLWGVII